MELLIPPVPHIASSPGSLASYLSHRKEVEIQLLYYKSGDEGMSSQVLVCRYMYICIYLIRMFQTCLRVCY